MTDDTADSGINMDTAVQSISDDLFGKTEATQDSDTNEEVLDETQSDETQIKAQDVTEDKTEEVIEEKPARKAPQSWKKEMHDQFQKLDPTVQDYIDQREAQMREGLEKDRTDANVGRTMRDLMTPYAALLKSQNVDEPTAVRYLLNAHYKLSTANPQEKEALAKEFLRSYGIGEPDNSDPEIKRLREELHGIKSHLTASQQRTLQETRERVESDVSKFASDPSHSYFDDVADDIVPLIKAGYSLDEAYEKAIWANPVTRQKELDRLQTEKEAKSKEKAKQDAQAALKAKSVNVRSRDTTKTPTALHGTMEDTLRDTYRAIQNRQ